MDLSVIIPVYNEEKTIGEVVDSVLNVARDLGCKTEVVVIDDGSIDGTKRVLDGYKDIRVLTHEINLGKGRALIDGFGYATGDAIVMIDSDGQMNPEDIPKLYEKLKAFDVVCGFRVDRNDPILRKILSKVFNNMVRILLGMRITDALCSLKGFRRDVTKIETRANGWLMDLELVWRARRKGYAYVEVPVSHNPRRYGHSKISVKSIVRMIYGLVLLRVHG